MYHETIEHSESGAYLLDIIHGRQNAIAPSLGFIEINIDLVHDEVGSRGLAGAS